MILFYSSIRKQGIVLRSANWGFLMFLHHSHHPRWERGQRKALPLELQYQTMGTWMLLNSLQWVFDMSSGLNLKRDLFKSLYCLFTFNLMLHACMLIWLCLQVSRAYVEPQDNSSEVLGFSHFLSFSIVDFGRCLHMLDFSCRCLHMLNFSCRCLHILNFSIECLSLLVNWVFKFCWLLIGSSKFCC